ncbi:MAG TPA: hypothetical protein VFG55_06445, partial [Rhodanobacteraceae bacterium]|nr:hypothetical protein [Rhodanobacteraceae bacterium]
MRVNRRRNAASTERLRSSLVVPIGIVVAIAFVCIIIAALSSARRADEVSVARETERLVGGVNGYADRMLRELASAATADRAVDRTAADSDGRWIAGRLEAWQKTLLRHELIFVVGRDGRLIVAGG